MKNVMTPTPVPVAESKGSPRRIWSAFAVVLWFLGLITLVSAAVLTRHHPAPWPVELAFSHAVQHIAYPAWIPALLDFIGTFDNPTPTGILIGALLTAMILMGWYRQGIFLALTVGIGNGINALVGDYVKRPRPSPHVVHVDVILKYNSFPSGHTCHMMVFYGFLLYLSLTKAVRTWPYRWTLIPLQAFALLNILLMGYSRVYEGEHWLGDVMGGYLSGTLWLTLFIFLYHVTTKILERRHAKKELAAEPVSNFSTSPV
jgi:undecaprenyl-diphosphatase